MSSPRIARLCIAWLLSLSLAMAATTSSEQGLRCIMYLTGQHNVIPSNPHLKEGITHIIIAFQRSDVFNVDETPESFPLFTSVHEVRQSVEPGTKVMVAIGGWGDSKGFEEAARDEKSRQRWSRQVKAMIEMTGADGVDVDWEFPGGNRDDYKKVPNSEREWEIEAFVLLLEQLRETIGPNKLLSVAVPGGEDDLIAFTPLTVPRIAAQVDFFSVMTYDMMGRRSTVVKHHSGISDTRDALQRYIDRGAPPSQINFGLGYYVKWFMTQECNPKQPLGCPTQVMEDPKTGADLGKTGGFSWHDRTPRELVGSFEWAQIQGRYFDDGSYGYWDGQEKRWWSYDTQEVIEQKVAEIAGPQGMGIGGVFAWGLGEDAPKFAHLKATLKALKELEGCNDCVKDEL